MPKRSGHCHPQFIVASKGWILCAGGKVDHEDPDLKSAAFREGNEEFKLKAEQIKRCFPLSVFDNPEHDSRGVISATYVVTLEDASCLKPAAEMKKYELKAYTPEEFKELVDIEGKGKRIGHMVIRQALHQFLAPHGYKIPEVHDTSCPVLNPTTQFDSPSWKILKQSSTIKWSPSFQLKH